MTQINSEILRDIFSWKKRHGSVYFLKIGTNVYVFKTLTREEYLAMLRLQDIFKEDVSEILLSQCLLYPEYSEGCLDTRLAGEIDYLLQCVTKESGFSESDKVKDDVDNARKELMTLESQIIILICRAFPHLKLEDIDKLTYKDMIRYLSVSEAILDTTLNIEKPKDKTSGGIDFEEENKVFGPDSRFKSKPHIKRGDVSK